MKWKLWLLLSFMKYMTSFDQNRTSFGKFNSWFFFFSVLALLRKFNFRKEDWVLGNVCTKFGIFLKFHNFIRSEVFSSWTIREHQLLHLVPGNNIQVPLLLLWGETISKVSKYFKTWCNSEVSWDTLLNSHDNA